MKNKKNIIFGIFLVVLLGIIVFRNVPFGNEYVKVNSKNFNIPKFSFNLKSTPDSISIKSLRSSIILKKELNEILESNYEKIYCNETEYYYSEKLNQTIIDYGVNNHFIYSTLYLKYVDYNYCNYSKMVEYGEKLGGLRRMHTFGEMEEDNKNISVVFLDTNVFVYPFEAELKVTNKDKTLENSQGYFIIENDKLIYTRTDITEKSNEIIIPEISIFTIVEDGVLKLDDNYLSKYESEIILK